MLASIAKTYAAGGSKISPFRSETSVTPAPLPSATPSIFNFYLSDNHVDREQPLPLTCSGGTHEQICDPTFDTGDLCDLTGNGPDGRTGQGRNKQQQKAQEACSEECPKESGLQWLLVRRSSRCQVRSARAVVVASTARYGRLPLTKTPIEKLQARMPAAKADLSALRGRARPYIRAETSPSNAK